MSNLTTSIIMCVLLFGIITWDVWLAVDKKRGNTISERIRAFDKKLIAPKLLLSYGFGLLMGHWFWT